MFGLLAKFAELLCALVERGLKGRRATEDALLASGLVEIVVELQAVIVRGRDVLRTATAIAAGQAPYETVLHLSELIREQAIALDDLRAHVVKLQPVMATFDSGLALELLTFVDGKSGLITRWRQQAGRSSRSSTTLFFLPHESIERLTSLGAAGALSESASEARADLIMSLGDEIAAQHAVEVRDIARLAESGRISEFTTASHDLDRATHACGSISKSLQSGLGPEHMLALRRKVADQEA